MPKKVVVTVEPHMEKVKLYYLGGKHRPEQKVMQILFAQNVINFPAKVGEFMEVERWAAADIIRRYKIQGVDCFTMNGGLAKSVASGKTGIDRSGTVIQYREMSNEEILRRAAEIQNGSAEPEEPLKVSSKKSKNKYDDDLKNQDEELAKMEA